ncbi:MAG: glycosyltransferase family 39 protein [Candidatus Dormibacteraeota bacterium]|nr:glycosyltransferase family 39 protein [Candidatus Dormibacteraeota bacterium]
MEWRASPYAMRVGALTAAAVAGRLLFLGFQPLWRDEAFTAVVVQRPLGPMLDAVRADSGAPLLYLLDNAVTRVSSSPAALRLVPAVAGAAAVPLMAALARRIGGVRAGAGAAALAVVAPALVTSARDARMYALATTLVVLATLLLLRAAERPSAGRWFAYAAAASLAMYTDYFAALAVMAEIVALVVVLRADARRVACALLSAAAAGATLVPWLIAAHGQFNHAGEFWVPPLSVTWVGGALVQFFTGPPVNDWVPGKQLLVAAQAVAVVVAQGLLAGLVIRRGRLSPDGRRALWYCVMCAVLALVFLVVISAFRPLITGSYASVLWGPLFAVLGAGLGLLDRSRLAAAALALTCGVSVALSAAATHPDTTGAIRLIDSQLGPGDVVDAHPSQYLLLLYYGDARVLQRTVVISSHVAWFWGTAAYPAGAVMLAAPAQIIANHGDIMFVAQPGETPENLPSGYHAARTACATGSCVTMYAPPA